MATPKGGPYGPQTLEDHAAAMKQVGVRPLSLENLAKMSFHEAAEALGADLPAHKRDNARSRRAHGRYVENRELTALQEAAPAPMRRNGKVRWAERLTDGVSHPVTHKRVVNGVLVDVVPDGLVDKKVPHREYGFDSRGFRVPVRRCDCTDCVEDRLAAQQRYNDYARNGLAH